MPNRAIVIGIAGYPRFGASAQENANLQGPVADAEAVRDWLVKSGSVAKGDVNLIVSRKPLPGDGAPNASPTENDICQAFAALQNEAQEQHDHTGRYHVGDRLYVYVGGHGFAPARKQGACFTANATKQNPVSAGVSDWVEWLRDAQAFSEYVFWMDACMDPPDSVVSCRPLKPPVMPPMPAGEACVIFAAAKGFRAVELRQTYSSGVNRVGGVFTRALLEGLSGAAADPSGVVTGRSLANYLRNGVRQFLPEAYQRNPLVAKEPEVVDEGPNIVLAKPGAQGWPVTFLFTQPSIGKSAKVWSGTDPRPSAPFTVDARVTMDLPRGLHLVEVPDTGIRHGFEVPGGGPTEVNVTELGLAVQDRSGEAFSLSHDTGDPTTLVILINNLFESLAQNREKLALAEPFGLYKLKLATGRATNERIFLLDSDDPDLGLELPHPTVALPLRGTALKHEYHEIPAANLAEIEQVLTTGDAEIVLFVRTWTAGGRQARDRSPWNGFVLCDERGTVVVDPSEKGMRNASFPDPFAYVSVAIPPGVYYVRRPGVGTRQEVEQSLVAVSGWRLEAYFAKVEGAESEEAAGATATDSMRVSLRMLRRGNRPAVEGTDLSFIGKMDRIVETARLALADDREILSSELEGLLMEKYQNPIAGIIGAHLVIQEHDRRQPPGDETIRWLDVVVPNLRALVGPSHPDVEALSLRCPNQALRHREPINAAPMFFASWRLMVSATADDPNLVPNALWKRVAATQAAGSFLIWAHDAATRRNHRRGLLRTIDRMLEAQKELPALVSKTRSMAANAPMAEISDVAPQDLDSSGEVSVMTPNAERDVMHRLGIPAVAIQELRER